MKELGRRVRAVERCWEINKWVWTIRGDEAFDLWVVCVPECMPVYVCVRQPSAWVLYFLRQGFSLAWNSLSQWDWLTCELQGSQHLVHKQTSSGSCACKANILLTEPFPWLCFHVFIDTQWSSCPDNLLGLLTETVFLGSLSDPFCVTTLLRDHIRGKPGEEAGYPFVSLPPSRCFCEVGFFFFFNLFKVK